MIWSLTPTCQNVNYYQLMHMNIALRTRSLIFFDGCDDEEWNDYYNDLLQKGNTLEYLYGEYMKCDTANIQDVIIDFMYFDKGYYEFVK